MRILYVALTRAKEKLIITSSIKDIEQNMHKWSSNISTEKMVSKYDILNGKNYMEMCIRDRYSTILRLIDRGGENID